MNIDLNQLIKNLIEQAEEKAIDLQDAKKLFLMSVNNINTKSYYNKNLTDVINSLNDMEIKMTSQIDTIVLMNITNQFEKRGNKPQTINKKIGALITMLKYLSNEIEVIDMPNFKFKKLKEDSFQGKALNEEEIKKCYQYTDSKSLRIRIVFRLMLETGIRRTEITRIKLKNISLEDQTIILQNLDTKSGKSRYLFLNEETNKILEEYIKKYNPKYYLFENDDNTQLSPNSISSIIERIKKDLDMENLSPHTLRRTFATLLLDNGANIISVKNLLGHSTLSQTQKYCLASLKQQQRDCLKYNPSTLLKK